MPRQGPTTQIRLSSFGYTKVKTLTERQRREVLDRIFVELTKEQKDEIVRTQLVQSLRVLANMHKNRSPAISQMFSDDAEWLLQHSKGSYIVNQDSQQPPPPPPKPDGEKKAKPEQPPPPPSQPLPPPPPKKQPQTYYDVLGVKPNASMADLRRAYLSKSKSLHPDKGGDEESFKELNRIYEMLSDPTQRVRYDLTAGIVGNPIWIGRRPEPSASEEEHEHKYDESEEKEEKKQESDSDSAMDVDSEEEPALPKAPPKKPRKGVKERPSSQRKDTTAERRAAKIKERRDKPKDDDIEALLRRRREANAGRARSPAFKAEVNDELSDYIDSSSDESKNSDDSKSAESDSSDDDLEALLAAKRQKTNQSRTPAFPKQEPVEVEPIDPDELSDDPTSPIELSSFDESDLSDYLDRVRKRRRAEDSDSDEPSHKRQRGDSDSDSDSDSAEGSSADDDMKYDSEGHAIPPVINNASSSDDDTSDSESDEKLTSESGSSAESDETLTSESSADEQLTSESSEDESMQGRGEKRQRVDSDDSDRPNKRTKRNPLVELGKRRRESDSDTDSHKKQRTGRAPSRRKPKGAAPTRHSTRDRKQATRAEKGNYGLGAGFKRPLVSFAHQQNDLTSESEPEVDPYAKYGW